MSATPTIPFDLPVGISEIYTRATNVLSGYRARLRYGSGVKNEKSKYFSNQKYTLEQNYNLAIEWLESMKLQKLGEISDDQMDTGESKKESKLPENICENINKKTGEIDGYRASYYNEAGQRRQTVFTGAKTLERNLELAVQFRDSMVENNPRVKKQRELEKQEREKKEQLENEKKIEENIINNKELELYEVDKICKTIDENITYKKLLQETELTTIINFVTSIGLTMDMFKIDEFWDGWNKKDVWILVNKDMLDWLGYKGKYGNQRTNMLESLKNRFRENIHYKIDLLPSQENINEPKKSGRKEHQIFLTYLCLKELSMMINTEKASEIRRSYIRREMLFNLYLKYQNDFMNIKQQKLLDQLKRKIFKLEKKHHYVKFKVEESSYYIFSYGSICSPNCNLHNFIKHGVAIKGGKNGPFDQRFYQHRETYKWAYLDFLVSAPPEAIEGLENCMEIRYRKNLNPSSGEVFEGISIDMLKTAAITFLESLCPGDYTIIEQSIIDEYNYDVKLMMSSRCILDEDNDIQNEIQSEKNIIQELPEHVQEKNDTNILEYKKLLKDIDSYTLKHIDPLMDKFNISKGKLCKAQKVAKLKEKIQEMLYLTTCHN